MHDEEFVLEYVSSGMYVLRLNDVQLYTVVERGW